MFRSFLTIAANRIIIDSMSGHLSIIDVFDGVRAQAFPIIIPNLSLLFYLHRDDDDPMTKELFVACSIDGDEVMKAPVSVSFQQGNKTRSIVEFDGFVIPKAGLMKLAVLDDKTILSELELPIEKLEIAKPTVKTTVSEPRIEGNDPNQSQ